MKRLNASPTPQFDALTYRSVVRVDVIGGLVGANTIATVINAGAVGVDAANSNSELQQEKHRSQIITNTHSSSPQPRT